MFSTLPWPKGCSSSAGLPAAVTAASAMTDASRSTAEWIASERTDTDPMIVPTVNLPSVNVVFETTISAP
jgi:hypothetical protein